MRLSLKVNGAHHVTAAINGPGYLCAHLNMAERPKDDEHSKRAWISGIQTLDSETVHMDWPEIELRVGDKVELQMIDDGDGDPPSSVRRMSESQTNLFTNCELARELLSLVSEFETKLSLFADKSNAIEPEEEQLKIATAVGRICCDLGESFLYPIYRRHKELVPDEMKGELL